MSINEVLINGQDEPGEEDIKGRDYRKDDEDEDR